MPARSPSWRSAAGCRRTGSRSRGSGVGSADEALDLLEAACEARVDWLNGVEATFDPLRAHPRFAPLLARLGLPAPAR